MFRCGRCEFTVPAEHKGVNEFQFLSSKVRGEVREMIILKDIKQSLMPQTEGQKLSN